ncbi:unnamed protein product [Rotaria sordida]|uniref:Uncharacterized protein n=1 Tax=Rotaria sordida TaxID=392033 RepID=A0A815MZQ6_9BILA|nr:unnamed protein product [Rotaria sordida]
MAMNDKNHHVLLPLPEPIDHNKKHDQSQQEQQHKFTVMITRPFQPLKPYRICPIHHLSCVNDILNLITQANRTMVFSIDTKTSFELRRVTFIKIELIQTGQPESFVLVFEVLFLPYQNTQLFSMIQALLKLIFVPSKKFFTWDNKTKNDLQVLVFNKYLSKKTLDDIHIIELQQPFKQWYNRTFKHAENCSVPSFFKDDTLYCICPYRPYKNINDKWSLDNAIKYVFNEFLGQANRNYMSYLYNVIYSVQCCLAITKLSMIVEYQSKVFFNTKLMTDPDRNIERDIDRFDDIFHRFDDDIDEEEDTNIDFDNLYMNIGKDNNNDVIEIEQLNDDKNNLIDSVFKEENLSQKLSQLSATDKEQEDSDKSKPSTVKKRPTLTPSTTTDNISKKMKPDNEESTSNQIPRYLSSHNKAFEQMINPILEKTTTTSINIEYLREIAILIHQLECIDLDRLL